VKRKIKLSSLITTLVLLFTTISFSIPVHSALTLNATNATFTFDHSGTAGSGATAFTAKYFNVKTKSGQNANTTGKNVGDIVRYNKVATVAGVSIDAVVTTVATGFAISDYDAPGSASNQTTYFQIDRASGVGEVKFRFAFYESGSYTTVGSGSLVVLQNLKVSSIDLDYGNQYTSFSGFQKYYLTSPTELAVSNTAPPLVKFTSTTNANNNALDKNKVEVEYLTLSEIDIAVGGGQSGAAYFGIGFGQSSWTTTPITIVNPYNSAPTSSNTTKNITSAVNTLLSLADFGTYADADSNPFTQVQITQLPTIGTLQFLSSGVWANVALNDVITTADINLNKLRITATSSGNFKFKVHDSLAYSASAYTLTYTTTAQAQTITFNNPGSKTLGSSTHASGATASSALTVALSSATSGICTITGLTINLIAEGQCTIRANQSGNGTYAAAPQVEQTFNIGAGTSQTITFADPGSQVLNTNPKNVASSASSTSGLTVLLTSFTLDVCTISSLNIVLIATGSCQVRATQAGNATFAPASPVERIFPVTPVTYNLAYTAGANGTLVGTASQTVATGTSGTAVTPTPNTGYSFTTWSDGSTANPRTDTNVTGAITQTATFAIKTYAVAYTAGANGSLTGTASQTINHGANATAITAVAASGYRFTTWSDGSTANPRTDTNVTAAITQTASFVANSFSITYNAGANGTGAQATQSSAGPASTVTLNAASTGTISRVGFVFGGWATTDGGTTTYNDQAVITFSNNLTLNLFPVWKVAGNFTVIFHSNHGTDVTATQTANTTTALTAKMFTRTGYTWSKWTTLPGGTGTEFADLANYAFTSDLNLYAQWTAINYTVTYQSIAGTVGTLPTQLVNKNYLDAITVAASTGLSLSENTFSSWSDGSNNYAPGSTYTMGAVNTVLTAVWTPITRTVTFDLNGGIGDAPAQLSKSNTQTFLLPTSTGFSYPGFTFAGWTASTDAATLLLAGSTQTMSTSARTFNAKWTAITYSVTYALDGGTGVLPTEANHLTGEVFTLALGTGLTKSGLTFNGWSDGVTNFQGGDSVEVLESNVTLTARWVKINYMSVSYIAPESTGTLPSEDDHQTGETFIVASGSGLTKSGFTFDKWDDGTADVSAGSTYTVGAVSIQFEAKWRASAVAPTGGTPTPERTIPNTTVNIPKPLRLISGKVVNIVLPKVIQLDKIVPVTQVIKMDDAADMSVQTILVNGVPTVATTNAAGQIKVKAIIGPKDLVTVEMTDANGDKSQAQVLLELEKYALANVNFANGSFKLTNSAKNIIKQAAVVIREHGFTEIDLTGHTDIKGGAKFNNKKLSDNRASAVEKYLEQQLKGTDINVTTSGNAFTNPVASSNSATGLALNRRVEIVVK